MAVAAAYVATATPANAQATSPPTGSTSPAEEAPGQGAAQATTAPAAPSSDIRTTTFADLQASVGYSSNPSLQLTNTRSSAFGRLSVNAYRAWVGERGRTTLSGFVENTTYLRGGYGSKQIFRVSARTDRSVSERVRVFGGLAASGDLGGQLFNRFTGPVGAPPPDNPDILNFNTRQYLINGQAGASITTSPLSSVSISAAAAHAFFTGRNKTADYTTYSGTFGYGHQLSERTSIGVNVSLQRQDFTGDNYSNVVNTSLTASTRLAEDISANGSVGLLAIYSHQFGESDHAYSPSFTASVCKFGERTQYCAAVSRSAAAPLSIGLAQNARSAAITTNFSLSYSRSIGRSDTFRAQLTGIDSSRVTVLNQGKFRTTYVTGLVSYDKKIANRLFGGISGGARRLFQTGPDPKMDYNANIYLRYRLGDRQ
jgi:hypothetical protein